MENVSQKEWLFQRYVLPQSPCDHAAILLHFLLNWHTFLNTQVASRTHHMLSPVMFREDLHVKILLVFISFLHQQTCWGGGGGRGLGPTLHEMLVR